MVEGKKLEDLSSGELLEHLNGMFQQYREGANRATVNIITKGLDISDEEKEEMLAQFRRADGFDSSLG